MSDLDSILNGEEPAEEIATPEPVTEQAEQPAERAESTKGDTEAETPAATSEPETVPVTALIDERRKRQEERQSREAAEQKLAELQQQATPRPDIFEDQEAYAKSITDEVRRQLDADKMEQVNVTANASEAKYRKDVGDAAFEETYSKFEELTRINPGLIQKAQQSSDPYKVVFDQVAKADRLAKLDNLDDYEAQIRAELTQKIRAELTEAHQAEINKTSSLTPSLANTPSSGSVGASTWTGPEPLSDVFGES